MTDYIQLEDGSGNYRLEDNSGSLLNENAVTAHTATPSDTVTVTDVISNAPGSVKTDTTTVTDADTKVVVSARSDTATVTEANTKAVGSVRADTITVTDANLKTVSITLAETVVVTENATPLLITTLNLADTVVVTDASTRAIGQASSDTVTVIDANTKAVGLRTAQETLVVQSHTRLVLTTAEGLVFGYWVEYTHGPQPFPLYEFFFPDTIAVTEGENEAVSKVLGETVNVTEAVSNEPGKELGETIAVTEGENEAVGKVLGETVNVTEGENEAFAKSLGDSVVVGESASPVLAGPQTYSRNDAVSVTDTVSFLIGKAAADIVIAIEAQTKAVAKVTGDIVTVTDARTYAIGRLLADSIVANDLNSFGRYVSLADTVIVTDSTPPSAILNPILAGGFYESLNRIIRETLQNSLGIPIVGITANAMYDNEPGNQTKMYIRAGVRIYGDSQVEFPSGHRATGAISLRVMYKELEGDREVLQTLDEIYHFFRKLTVQEVRFQPPRIVGKYEVLIPFSRHV